MAQKILNVKRRKVAPVKGAKDEAQKIVLVGTYRSACRAWLLATHGSERRSYYNFPFHGTDKELQQFKSINCLFLFSTEYAPILRTAKYMGVITGEELKTQLNYPVRDNPHSDRYVLFKTYGNIGQRDARAIRDDEQSRFVIGVDKVARSRHKWMDILSCYVSSTKVAFDGWALTNKIPKWICNAAALMPHEKSRVLSQQDFFAGVGAQNGSDVWDNSVPVEKSSYLQDDNVLFLNTENVQPEPNKLRMLDLFCGAGGFAVGAAWSGFQSVFGVDHLEPAMSTWMYNHPHALGCLGDIRQVDPREVRQILAAHGIDHIDLITGGVPCQGFSRANRKHTDTASAAFCWGAARRRILPKLVSSIPCLERYSHTETREFFVDSASDRTPDIFIRLVK